MKRLYILLFFLFSLAGFSQAVLNQAETVSRTVQDPQEVRMITGFNASSSISNPFIAKIGVAPLDGPANPTESDAGSGNPSGNVGSNDFHDTQGNIEVNSGGQLQFTLPIALPPGVKSVGPQMELLYSSGSGNSIAGYGWSMSGITSISRVGKNIERDGEVQGVQLDNSDYYSFNGHRLILKSGEYGKDGAEYVTEKYSNIRIRSFGQNSALSTFVTGPAYWEVSFEDGSKAWYGMLTPADINAATPAEYNIVKWRDSQGNYISYLYDVTFQPGGFNLETGALVPGFSYNVARIVKVSWGGNEDLAKPHFNEINFAYRQRDYKEASYVNGLQFIQDRLLDQITVYASGSLFKKYAVTYKKLNTNYQFVDRITESNSLNESANAVVFDNVSNPFIPPTTFKQNARFDDIYGDGIVSGDFNGDGKVDFIRDNKIMLGRLDGNAEVYDLNIEGKPLVAVTFVKSGIVLNKQVLLTHSVNFATQQFILKGYEYDGGSNSTLIYTRSYDISSYAGLMDHYLPPPPSPDWDAEGNRCPGERDAEGNYVCYQWVYKHYLDVKVQDADFDGDGISDLLLTLNYRQNTNHWQWDENGYFTQSGGEYTVRTGQNFNFIWHHANSSLIASNFPDSPKVADFDGDGKSEILTIENSKLTVYKVNSQYQFTPYFDTPKESLDEVIYFGDFNGDGKTDIIAPVAEGSSNWRMYISTGKSFRKELYTSLFLYKPADQGPPRKRRNTQRTYAAPDLNKDGKSDLIVFESQVWFRDGVLDWNNPDSSYGLIYLRNDGVNESGKPLFSNVYNVSPVELNADTETVNFSMYGEHYIPLFGNFRVAQLNTDFVILHKTKLITWDFGNKLNTISKIKSIMQGGIKTDIEYKSLTAAGNIYQSYYATAPLQYPFVNITENINYEVVSKLIQGARKQEYRYRGMMAHLHGRGMIGFRHAARSTFYAAGFEQTIIWSGSEIDPMQESLPIKEWSIKTSSESAVFPGDLSLSNTQLLYFKQYIYKTDKLLNGNVVTTYSNLDKPKIVIAVNPQITTTKDFQKDIKTVHTVTDFDQKFLPLKSSSNINDGFAVSSSEVTYYPAITSGDHYVVGKPQMKKERMEVYGDTNESKEEFEYSGYLLSTKKSYNRDNSAYIEESYQYDGFGNIIQKTVNSPLNTDAVTSKTVYSDYDEKGRFVIKKKDNLGLITEFTYNNWGQLLSQKDTFDNTLTNVYDAWGKLLSSKTNLGGYTKYTYEKLTDGSTKVIEYAPDNDQKITYSNKLGQVYKTSVKGYATGSFVSAEIQYDVLGRKVRESEPYFEGTSANKWNTVEYDDYSRPIKQIIYTGKITDHTYNIRTVTTTEINSNGRFKTQVFDPIGNISSSTDKGGKIDYKYSAAGEILEAKYGTNIVKTRYDLWGQKSFFYDPSNSIDEAHAYKYSYNGYGQLTKAESPKGVKNYIYNENGQLLRQTETGDTSQKIINFLYNVKGQIVAKNGTANGKPYSSFINYDANGRIISSGEHSSGRYYYKKNIKYDDRGRVTSYEKGLLSGGQATKVVIENLFSAWSGDLEQVKDKTSGKVLSELTGINAKGQVLEAKLGGTIVQNTYDSNNFLTNIDHKNAANNSVLSVNYSFNAIKNELNSRTTAGDFSILESFEYDDNNRLSKWSNPVSGADSYNTYDQLGRIKENDQIGTIKFDNSQKMYQPTGAVLNPAGAQNYLNNLIQTISYNENNDPVFIDGVQGDVSFGYGLTAMRQEVTFGGALSESNSGKYTRFYSEDGSYEVTVDNVSGKEKHLLYIGAGPYEADIIYLKNYTESSGFYRFLHKDYLGSILAITDEEGSKLEQRHYDAWGSLTHLKIANGSIITDQGQIANSPLVLDRGYTSHEHFFEVGIIHMNGRLYDPLLRRFLNADENIQDPANTQNYNKYAYVLNNPLMYNDPSGEFVMLIAVGIAVITSVATDYYLNRPINLPALAQSVIFAVLSAKVSTAIGNLFEAGGKVAAALKGWSAVAKAGAHAVAQGTLSWMQGGNFLSGALAGGFASISTDVLGGAIKKSGEFSILRSRGFAMLTGTVSGGIGSVLGGGNFWVGAGQGLMVTTFNYLAHQIKYNGDSWDLDGDGRISLDEANNWYRKGGGKPITLDASKIDLNSADTSKWKKGGRYGVQTLFNSKEGRVLGNITVEYLGNNQVKILPDTYNFEMHGNPLSVRHPKNFLTWIRNTFTLIGLAEAGSGIQYKINFSGVNTIKSN